MERSAQQGKGGSTTLQVWLSEDEYAELRRAVANAQAPNRSLLVFQAIHAGLEGGGMRGIQRKRTRAVNTHVSTEFKKKIRAKARMYGVTQQALLRGLLFQYIRNESRQTNRAEGTAKPTTGHGK